MKNKMKTIIWTSPGHEDRNMYEGLMSCPKNKDKLQRLGDNLYHKINQKQDFMLHKFISHQKDIGTYSESWQKMFPLWGGGGNSPLFPHYIWLEVHNMLLAVQMLYLGGWLGRFKILQNLEIACVQYPKLWCILHI